MSSRHGAVRGLTTRREVRTGERAEGDGGRRGSGEAVTGRAGSSSLSMSCGSAWTHTDTSARPRSAGARVRSGAHCEPETHVKLIKTVTQSTQLTSAHRTGVARVHGTASSPCRLRTRNQVNGRYPRHMAHDTFSATLTTLRHSALDKHTRAHTYQSQGCATRNTHPCVRTEHSGSGRHLGILYRHTT